VIRKVLHEGGFARASLAIYPEHFAARAQPLLEACSGNIDIVVMFVILAVVVTVENPVKSLFVCFMDQFLTLTDFDAGETS
jgi:hypothetical protein